MIIGFSTTKAWYSRLMRWLTHSRVSHAYLVYDHPLWQRYIVLEANLPGYIESDYKKWRERGNDVVAEVFVSDIDISIGFKAAESWLGDGYDFTGLFGMIPVLIARLFKRRIRNPWLSSKSLFCSEAIARILKLSNYPGFNLDPGIATPEDLLNFFEKNHPEIICYPYEK